MIPVLFADEHFIIINKPHDLLSVPGKGPEKQDCVGRRIQAESHPTARIVHRLDYATSGLMVLALTADSLVQLSRLFQEHKMCKRYHAIISGTPTEDNGIIEQPLRCDWERRPLQMIDHDKGKYALTRWERIETLTDSTRVFLYPQTGRSHQLRVHMLWMGHPITGDRFYADEKALSLSDRLMLHAEELSFTHPYTQEPLSFLAEAPF
ncbi:RluA family pseudouridine synthase [Neptunomonas qingdaonensis]|uniref:Dual-specificity RNA pseudouridine synthase RluA n=1 Tax=Neptunomonas qingdaonensis TaxID=1045558 RepID=A0A1I2RKQ1_9GAMM|nr:RluA family pseudouridine synthase [Neptunomonas qingdaonensis]SFG40673.1 tRNA pseudouridine32 synthase / 23S rRNA pseudouridine746 synthase [Neptunomonas qingdaonensis]